MADQTIIQQIEQMRRFGSLPGVTVSKQLLAAVGNPQTGLAFLHIAGTNGKGSTAAFLRAVLLEAGIRTGLFTSPHLVDFTERIQVDGRRILPEDASRLGKRLMALDLDIRPSMFDYCLAMALLYFKEQNCKLVILETGLGGRLDATNAVGVPLVSIVTRIGYDHTDVLGSALTEIAAEKAGILKPGTRAVLGGQEPEALAVLKERCTKLGIPYQTVDTDRMIRSPKGFCYPGEQPYRLRMLGDFQYENAMASIFAIRELMAIGYPITEEALHRGIAQALWNGRMELVCQEPFLLLDGAHNPDGAAALAKSLQSLYPGEKFCFVMGVLADKDYRRIAAQILPLAKRVIAVTPEGSRGLQAKELAGYIRQSGVLAEEQKDLAAAFAPFFAPSGRSSYCDKTVALGSLHFIGEIRKLFHLPL